MEFVKIADSDKTKYMDLLLLADEQVSMIEKYLYLGDMFALCDDGVKAICVVTQERPGVFELKNIVTAPHIGGKDMASISYRLLLITTKKLVTSYTLEQAIALRSFVSTRSADFKDPTLLKTFL